MNREQLKERINDLPEFELRDVQVLSNDGEWILQEHKAICERDGQYKAVAFCWKNYKLLQFKEVFEPILDSVDGNIDGYIYTYKGYANFTFYPDDENLKINNHRLGLVAVNSVDLSSSIMIKFCVDMGNYKFVVPPKVAGLKKQHKGNVESITRNYIDVVGKVKDVWRNIMVEFPKYSVVINIDDNVESNDKLVELRGVLTKLKIGERMQEKIKSIYEERTLDGSKFTLWDLFETVMIETANKNYKTDIHREKRMETLSNSIFEYATLLSI